MTPDLALFFILGLGEPIFQQDFTRETPVKFELDAQILKSQRLSIHLTGQHVSDASNGHDWGDNYIFIEGRLVIWD